MARKRHFLKPVWAALLSAALLAAPVAAAAAEPSGETEARGPVLAIYTTGDMAGRVYQQDPLTGERVAAGYQNVASAMEQEREQVDAALLLDSGDAVDNSLLQDGGEAEALALRAIGYDVLVPGLNEFRLGPDARDGFFDALTAEEEETAPVRVLSGNYLDGESQEPAAEGYAVLTAEVGGRAVRVGVLGLGAIDGAERLPASGTTRRTATSGSGRSTGRKSWRGRTATWWWWSATPTGMWRRTLRPRPPALTWWWAATAPPTRIRFRTPRGRTCPWSAAAAPT